MSNVERQDSYQEEIPPERYEQIIRVDANGLLKTIKDLESKLSEHQRQDKVPAWAVSLEARIMRIEQSQMPHSPEAKTRSSAAAVPVPVPVSSSLDERDTTANSALIAEEKIPTTLLAKNEMRSLQDLVLEDRVVNKVRAELENKVHSTEVNFEAKLSSFHLEMERLHKLLQIRPTTSEMQQVIVSVHQIEKDVKASLDIIKEDALASLRDRVSEEILSIVAEMKSTRSSNDSSIGLIHKAVADYAVEMTELRQGVQSSVVELQENIEQRRQENKTLEDKMAAIRKQTDNEIRAVEGSVADVRIELRADVEQLAAYKSKNAEMVGQLQTQISGNQERSEKAMAKNAASIDGIQSVVGELRQSVLRFETSYDKDMQQLTSAQTQLGSTLDEQQFKVTELKAIIEELLTLDLAAKIAKHDETFNTIKYDLLDLHNVVDTALNADIKTINLKLSQLQEQCNILIPQMCTDLSVRIDRMTDRLNTTDETINNTREQLVVAESTIADLLPLKDRMAAAEETSVDIRKEIDSMKETLLNTIDTTDDLLRRMDDSEEAIDHMDDTIVNRMNQVRDALMDTLLEKQTETSNQVRNVRENLEVMSMLGDGSSTSSAAGGGGGAVGGGGAGSKSAAALNKMRKNSAAFASAASLEQSEFIDDAPQAVVRFDDEPPAARNSLSPPTAHYKRPSMTGAVVTGQQAPIALSRQPSAYLHDAQSIHQPLTAATAAGGAVAAGVAGSVGASSQMRRQSSVRSVHGTTPGAHPAQLLAAQPSFRQTSPMQQQLQQQPQVVPRSRGLLRQASTRSAEPQTTAFRAPIGGIATIDSAPASPNTAAAAGDDADSLSLTDAVRHQTGGQLDNDAYEFNDEGSVGFSGKAQDQQMVMIPAPYQQLDNSSAMNGPESNALGQQFSQLMGTQRHHNNSNVVDPMEYVHFQQAQFMSDLCLNFEELSVRRKRVAALPPTVCESIAEVAMELAEFMAKMADFEMVEGLLLNVYSSNGSSYSNSSYSSLALVVQDTAAGMQYDEGFVLARREHKVAEFVSQLAALAAAASAQPQPGVVRMDARALFVSLVKKALDLFMSKHNQVLVAGNSRLGRIKIPSCIACDRPLVEKVRLDQAVSRGGGGSISGGPSSEFGGTGMLRHLTASHPHPQQHSGGGSLIGSGGSSSLMRWGDSQEPDPDHNYTFPPATNNNSSNSSGGVNGNNKRPNMHGHSLAPLEKKSNTKLRKSQSAAAASSASSQQQQQQSLGTDATSLSLSAKLPTVS